MRTIWSVLVITLLVGSGACPALGAEVWIESTQSDFADGKTPGGLGANIYASASGDVRMVANTWDLNQDGYKDVIFANRSNNSTSSLRSYIYWGSASGYSPVDLDSLPTQGASGTSASDLNRDGFVDLVFSNSFSDASENIDSYVYWGSASGYNPMDVEYLPTSFAHGNTVADLNNDGYLDVVFCNYTHDGNYNTNSHIYWGSASGYSPANLTSLPTSGAFEAIAVDLNEDGYLDLIISNHHNGATHVFYSYIYWGSATGYSPVNKDSVFTRGALGISVADLDDDSYVDLIVSNYFTGVTRNIYSYIYWGSPLGYSTGNLDSLPTHGALGSSVADLDDDGYLDLVFSNHSNDMTYNIYSYIYWGSPTGYSAGNRDSLPTHGAYGNVIADLDRDGYLDVVFANYCNDVNCNIPSYIYWGSAAGYTVASMDSLPTHGASLGIEKDLGSIHRRDSIEVYSSSVFDAGQKAAWDSIAWVASTPLGSSVSILVRTGDTVEPDTTWSGWVTVSDGENVPDSLDSRCIQYRALLTTDYEAVPRLEEVRVSWEPLSAVTLYSPNGGENWTVGESHAITWLAYHIDGVDSIDLHLSTDAGSGWSTISTGEPNDSSYTWMVPPTPSESCLVRAVAYRSDTVTGEDTSDSLFTISDQNPPDITVLYPNGGEELLVGDTVDIEWAATDNGVIDSISIYYSTSGGFTWDTLSTGETNDSVFTWEVPPTPSIYCLVKIEAFDEALNVGFDTSDSLFTIYATGVEESEIRLGWKPVAYAISEAVPNPNMGSAVINYQLPLGSVVTLTVLDAGGRVVRTLVYGFKEPGWYSARWDGKDSKGSPVPGGTYFCRIAAGDFRAARKITLIR